MAEGTSTFEGLSLPRLGEYEQVQQDPTLDMVTLTGSTGQTGDFIVCQDSDGTEKFAVDVNGNVAFGLSSTAYSAVTVSISCTGAIAAYSTAANAVLVSMSSKATLNSAFAYSNTEGTCNALLGVYGSKAPSYLLSMSGSGGAGWVDNSFVDTGLYLVSALATTVPITAIKVIFGDSVLYIPCLTTTSLAAS